MTYYRKIFFITILLLSQSINLIAKGDKNVLLNLSGRWKFSIGDNISWSQPDYVDTSWETIKVPSAWEDQGFYGYDGFGWYRTSFMVTKEMKSKELYIIFGYISDVDQVFLNGKLIGFSGSFPPDFSSAHDAKRRYPIPEEYLKLNEKNIISVRVYNHQMEGGIISGEVGIVSLNYNKPEISMAGLWYFKTGDSPLWKDTFYQDKHWQKLFVPGNWMNQGYKDYTGIAWYRKHINIPKEFENQKMILLLGNIQDADEVYINGVMINSIFENQHIEGNERSKKDDGSESFIFRYYIIPKSLLKINNLNLISVKVLNNKDKGGLVEGPVGIIKSANLVKYQKGLINYNLEK
jgi:sialate O-acetylesterase